MKTITISITAEVASDKPKPAEQATEVTAKTETVTGELRKAVAAIGKVGTVRSAQARVESTRAGGHEPTTVLDLK